MWKTLEETIDERESGLLRLNWWWIMMIIIVIMIIIIINIVFSTARSYGLVDSVLKKSWIPRTSIFWVKGLLHKIGKSALCKVFYTISFIFLSRIQRFDPRPVHVGPVVDQVALRQLVLAAFAILHYHATSDRPHTRLFKRHQYASVIPKKWKFVQI
jgi:phosphoglycerol transferase MdoB-like AlkP superfamily enzyme